MTTSWAEQRLAGQVSNVFTAAGVAALNPTLSPGAAYDRAHFVEPAAIHVKEMWGASLPIPLSVVVDVINLACIAEQTFDDNDDPIFSLNPALDA